MAEAEVAPGAVVIRSADPEVQLQGLRTALSLSMGDRPATIYLVGDGVAVLDLPAASEAAENLAALAETGVAVVAEQELGAARDRVRVATLAKILEQVAAAEFQQTF